MVRAAIVVAGVMALGGNADAQKCATAKKGAVAPFPKDAAAAALLLKRGSDTILTQWTGRYLVAMGRFAPFDAVIYDACTRTWSSVPAWSGEAKLGHELHLSRLDGSRVVVTALGGAGVVVLDPATRAWSAPTPAQRIAPGFAWKATKGAPVARENGAEIEEADKFVVWGGNDSDVKGDGGIYDRAAKTWTPISNTGAPRARSMMGAAWTKGRLAVWGGWSKSGNPSAPTFDCLSDGAIYDSTKRTWTMIAAKGAPTARQNAITMVDGDRVYVFGGNDGCPQAGLGKELADGAVLDTKIATWTPFALPSAVVADQGYPKRASAYVLPDHRVVVRGAEKMWIYDPAKSAFAAMPAATNGHWIALGLAGDKLVGWGKVVVVNPGGGCDGPRPPNTGCDPMNATMAYSDDGWLIQF